MSGSGPGTPPPEDARGPGQAAPQAPGRYAPFRKRTIVITRAEEKGRMLLDILVKLGARVISIPTIRFEPPEDPEPLHRAIRGLESYRWVLFTSATGVLFFFEAARRLKIPDAVWSRLRFAVVGVTTATQLASMGIKADRAVIAGSAAALADALIGPQAVEPLGPGDLCLMPQTHIARADMQERLRVAGVPVDSVIAYRTLPEPAEKARPFLDEIERGSKIDAIAFASPSAFENFLIMTAPRGEAAIRAQGIPLFSIGPTTTHAMRELGFAPAREASPFTAEGMIDAMGIHFSHRGGDRR